MSFNRTYWGGSRVDLVAPLWPLCLHDLREAHSFNLNGVVQSLLILPLFAITTGLTERAPKLLQ